MIFSSYEFLYLFLPFTFAAVWLTFLLGHKRLPLGILLVASLIFIGWNERSFLIYLLASALANFAIGLLIARQHEHKQRTLIMVAGVTANILFLAWFKYTPFLLSLADTPLSSPSPIVKNLPLGISFYTLQQIAYLIDSWRSKTPERSIRKYLLFVAFFPQLIAGPIVHFSQVRRQLAPAGQFGGWQNRSRPPARARSIFLVAGISLFTIGLAKKVLIADSLGPFADLAFQSVDAGRPLSTIDAWISALSYTFQIYFDFSGYADMALGLGLMFGIRLPRNFLSPYRATSIVAFWQKWHVTLSAFLRDYLYIPLGGNRRGKIRRHVNIFITMLIGGIWHGAGTTFILWGLAHAVLINLNHLFRALRARWTPRYVLPPLLAWLITMTALVPTWVMFRATSLDGAWLMLRNMAGNTTDQGMVFTNYPLVAALLALALGLATLVREPYDLVLRPARQSRFSLGRMPITMQAILIAALFLGAVVRMPFATRFIYFQF